MPSLNWITCDDQLQGWCGALHSNSKNYAFVFITSIIFTYVVPVVAIVIIFLITGISGATATMLLSFSPVMPGLASILSMSSFLAVAIASVIILLLDAVYLIYMARQIGIFIALPIAIEALKWIIMLSFHSLSFIAVILSVIPFMPLAVGVHYVMRLIGGGGGMITSQSG
jgi:hypothetical protein